MVIGVMGDPADSLRVSNAELATVREAMRELHRLLAALEQGELDKVVIHPEKPDARRADHPRALQPALVLSVGGRARLTPS